MGRAVNIGGGSISWEEQKETHQKKPQPVEETRYVTIVFKYKTRSGNVSSIPSNLMSNICGCIATHNRNYSSNPIELYGMYTDTEDMTIEEQNKVNEECKIKIKK